MTSWLITGGVGSFGQAFTRKLLADPETKRIVIYSRDEYKQAVMRAEFTDPRMRFIIGSVTDEQRIAEAMEGVDYCVHAAALKRVEVAEENPVEAVMVNVMGTVNVVRACKAANVRKAVLLSTDKAAQPFTHYGVTKSAAERTWCRANVYTARQRTRFAATRYGNVLGSRGSVVPKFRDQARLGGPLDVRDPHATRFWMSMDAACELVARAFRDMRGGEVFVPKLASSSVGDLAEAIAPGMAWVSKGLGQDEKLHETLISEDEARHTFDYGDHYRIEPQRTWEDTMAEDIGARPVAYGFAYRSDTNPDRLTVAGLGGLVA